MTGVGMQCMKQTRHLGPRAYSKITGQLKLKYDAVIIGGGHNGLVAAAYLQKSGLSVVVLERRHVIGGAAVTEEIIPGFKFSRASYLLSLLRPQIYKDLELKRHGLKIYFRDPYSFTPLLESVDGRPPRSLLLWADMVKNQQQIAQFSKKDAEAYPKYLDFMDRLVSAIEPLLDAPPVDMAAITQGSLLQRVKSLRSLQPLIKAGITLGSQFPKYYEVLTGPISKILDRWFESEPLKGTLAVDAVIGAMVGPSTPGSGYVLLHHVMGDIEGRKGSWGYVEGGMGMVSNAIAKAAKEAGAEIYTEKVVEKILVDNNRKAYGVVLQDGTEVHSRLVLSNASPHHTFLKLTPQEQLPEEFKTMISQFDTKSPVTKINVAVDRLPNFLSIPNTADGKPLPHHQCSVFLNTERMNLLDEAHEEACQGKPSTRPMMELCIPSSLDPTLAPPGCHVISIFSQYTPYTLTGGRQWDEEEKNRYADNVFGWIEKYAPGFKSSVIGRDVLTPPDFERIFGLPGWNIFHGSMSLDQLYFARPGPGFSDYRSPIQGLYLCGSGAHPGKKIRIRWRSIRDRFRWDLKDEAEECRSGSGAVTKKKAIFFHMLDFLRNVIDLRPTTSNLSDEEDELEDLDTEQDAEVEGEDVQEQTQDPTSQISSQSMASQGTDQGGQHVHSRSQRTRSSESSGSSRSSRRPRGGSNVDMDAAMLSFMEEMKTIRHDYTKDPFADRNDPDVAFLRNLYNHLRQTPSNKKMEVQTAIFSFTNMCVRAAVAGDPMPEFNYVTPQHRPLHFYTSDACPPNIHQLHVQQHYQPHLPNQRPPSNISSSPVTTSQGSYIRPNQPPSQSYEPSGSQMQYGSSSQGSSSQASSLYSKSPSPYYQDL